MEIRETVALSYSAVCLAKKGIKRNVVRNVFKTESSERISLVKSLKPLASYASIALRLRGFYGKTNLNKQCESNIHAQYLRRVESQINLSLLQQSEEISIERMMLNWRSFPPVIITTNIFDNAKT